MPHHTVNERDPSTLRRSLEVPGRELVEDAPSVLPVAYSCKDSACDDECQHLFARLTSNGPHGGLSGPVPMVHRALRCTFPRRWKVHADSAVMGMI